MSVLTVKIPCDRTFGQPYVTVDGQPVAMLKKHGFFVGKATVDNNEAELSVSNVHTVSGKLWFLWELLFMLLSVFGLFAPRSSSSGYCLDFCATVFLEGDTEFAMRWCPKKDGGPALAVSKKANLNVRCNRMYINKSYRRRYKLILAMEILFWIAVAVLIAVLAFAYSDR